MNDAIDVTTIIHDNIPTLDTWVEETDYEYDIRRSEVIDYSNTIIDEQELDRVSQDYEPDTMITEWSELFTQCNVTPDSSEASTMKIFLSANISLYQELQDEITIEEKNQNVTDSVNSN